MCVGKNNSSLLEESELLVGTPRNVATREAAKKLLDEITMDGNLDIFDAFAQKLVKSIEATFPASTAHLSEKESGRMLSQFHTLRIEELGKLWKQELYSRLGGWRCPIQCWNNVAAKMCSRTGRSILQCDYIENH